MYCWRWSISQPWAESSEVRLSSCRAWLSVMACNTTANIAPYLRNDRFVIIFNFKMKNQANSKRYLMWPKVCGHVLYVIVVFVCFPGSGTVFSSSNYGKFDHEILNHNTLVIYSAVKFLVFAHSRLEDLVYPVLRGSLLCLQIDQPLLQISDFPPQPPGAQYLQVFAHLKCTHSITIHYSSQ